MEHSLNKAKSSLDLGFSYRKPDRKKSETTIEPRSTHNASVQGRADPQVRRSESLYRRVSEGSGLREYTSCGSKASLEQRFVPSPLTPQLEPFESTMNWLATLEPAQPGKDLSPDIHPLSTHSNHDRTTDTSILPRSPAMFIPTSSHARHRSVSGSPPSPRLLADGINTDPSRLKWSYKGNFPSSYFLRAFSRSHYVPPGEGATFEEIDKPQNSLSAPLHTSRDETKRLDTQRTRTVSATRATEPILPERLKQDAQIARRQLVELTRATNPSNEELFIKARDLVLNLQAETHRLESLFNKARTGALTQADAHRYLQSRPTEQDKDADEADKESNPKEVSRQPSSFPDLWHMGELMLERPSLALSWWQYCLVVLLSCMIGIVWYGRGM
ncbi:hypothetical protein BZG36_00384 [Bifiguratus adelaidae]|uniref:Uncharacterized protein n=1 Tax=Bifiguratus adelaidae TaxID=1938954 RepID=A0A261Y835_9FUNG|nr:hypothetical protein BZG36_00384 [Bifiguratus adelaidae]